MITPRVVRAVPIVCVRWLARTIASLTLLAAIAAPAAAQRVVRNPEQVVSVSKGASALIVNASPLQRFSIGDPAVAEAITVSPTEILVNGKTVGVTSLFLWDNTSGVQMFSIEVTADAAGLQRYLQAVLPGQQIDVVATGNILTLTGQVRDASVAQRAVEIAKGSGAVIVDNIVIPDATQVLLKVRFAEINRSASREWRSGLRTVNPQDLSNPDILGGTGAARTDIDLDEQTTQRIGDFSDGLLEFGLFTAGRASFEALIRALHSRGDFRSLAEPNVLALPGREATLLAGGEFPYPTIQGGGGAGAVAIVFKEFGVKLKFTPTITRNGSIRLKVAPEVSSLDFANALQFQGLHHSSAPHPARRDRGGDAGRAAPVDRGAARQLAHRQRQQDSHPG